jgi:hypothetical protein
MAGHEYVLLQDLTPCDLAADDQCDCGGDAEYGVVSKIED